MYWTNHYVIDWEKVQTLDDMKRILAAVNIAFEPDDSRLSSIKDFVREEPKGKPIAVMY